MNNKYVIHPGDYAIGENEKLYADMAAKGWLLEKRGRYFSRFIRAAPQSLKYRLELAPSEMFEREFPEEQRTLYEDSGWRYVTGGLLIHVFSAPEGSAAPELHTDPRQQAGTLKGLRRKYYFGWIPPIVILLLNLWTLSIGGKGIGHVVSVLGILWVTHTAFFTLLVLSLTWSVYTTLHGALHIARLRRMLKHGRPIDHAPKKRQRLHRAVNAAVLICCLVLAALSIVQLAQYRTSEIPPFADGPYLLLRDLGWDGEHTSVISGASSDVKIKHSLLADQWSTYESVAAGSGSSWMYQDIYRMRGIVPPEAVVSLLMASSFTTRNGASFERVEVAGLDAAYMCKWEYIAFKGDTVYRVTYSDPDVYTDKGTQVDVLRALAELDR